MYACPGIQGLPLVPVSFLCFLIRGIFGDGLRGGVTLLEHEEVGDPVCTHQEFLQGSGGVHRVFDAWLAEVKEVDGGLHSCGLEL